MKREPLSKKKSLSSAEAASWLAYGRSLTCEGINTRLQDVMARVGDKAAQTSLEALMLSLALDLMTSLARQGDLVLHGRQSRPTATAIDWTRPPEEIHANDVADHVIDRWGRLFSTAEFKRPKPVWYDVQVARKDLLWVASILDGGSPPTTSEDGRFLPVTQGEINIWARQLDAIWPAGEKLDRDIAWDRAKADFGKRPVDRGLIEHAWRDPDLKPRAARKPGRPRKGSAVPPRP